MGVGSVGTRAMDRGGTGVERRKAKHGTDGTQDIAAALGLEVQADRARRFGDDLGGPDAARFQRNGSSR